MAFYRFGEMTIDQAEIIAKDLGLKNGDPYEQVLVTTNGCRFELEDEHWLYVEKLDAKIWIDVLYGDTKNYRSNVFYWNDKYGNQIPENAIIIGDTQNNGFIVYVYSGLEKGIYYWDDSYAFDCSNKDCNAYRIANDIKSLFENLKITYRILFARRKKCKPNIDFGKDNMLYCATGSEKIQTIDAKECKEITHKCNEFKIKFEFTRQYDIETAVLRIIKKVEDGTEYVFPEDIRNFIFDTNVKNVKQTYFGVFEDKVNTPFEIIKFEDYSYERNAWDVNCSGEDVDYAIEKGDFERARTLQQLHKNYVVFGHCEKAVNDFFAIEKSTNKIFAFNWTDLNFEKVADDFASFVDSFYNKDEESKQKTNAKKEDIQAKQRGGCKVSVSLEKRIIKDTRIIAEMMGKTGYEYKDRYSYDELSNKYFNYWMLFEEKKDEIQKLLGESIATILYSQFYWSQYCISRLEKIGDLDSGSMQEYRFHVFDDMEEIEDIDWDEVGEVGEEIQNSMQ